MNWKNEQQLLFVIRYALPAIILVLSFIIITFLYYENKVSFEKLKQATQEKFINDKKKIVKEQVDNVYDYIISEQKSTEESLKASLISRVHEAHTIIKNIQEQYQKTHSKEQIVLMIRAAIKDIRFNNGRGYFFINDKNGKNIIHPIFPHLEGENLFNIQDTKGTYILQESVNLLKKNSEAYQEWYWFKDKNSVLQYRKIGFVKNIDFFNWFIGTGEYVEDFSQDIQKKVVKQVNKFRFGANGYIFVLSEDNRYLANRRQDVIGKSVFDNNNLKNIKETMTKMWDKANSGGGFIQYVQKINPITNKPTEKLAYVRKIPQWNWLIGTGFYLNEVQPLIDKEKEILTSRHNENLKNILLVSSFITLLLVFLSVYISNIIERKFKKYKEDINHHIEENKRQYELLAQKSKLAAMGEMIENIAHQWRQPLSAITTASSGIKLQKEMNLLSDKLLDEAMDNIGNSANHLSETIEDFRDFFKPDKAKSEFTLKEAVNKTFNLLSSQIQQKEIEVIENIEDIKISGFERELLQVLLNLMNNAKDALEHKKSKKYIFIDICTKNSEVIIEIKDNAGGIDKNIIERIFEPYFTTKHKSQGTGLGLYMSEEIITRHMNGSIDVKNVEYEYNNTVYKGAVFILRIPLS